MNDELVVFRVEYRGGHGGFGPQDIIEYLIATPTALLKYKVCNGASRSKLFTDVQAQGDQFFRSIQKIKSHEWFRRMERAARSAHNNSPLKGHPEQLAIRNFRQLLDEHGLEPLIEKDEKAKTALMTAMGHHGDLMLPEVVERAREETKRQRAAIRAQEATNKYADLVDWGIF